MERDVVWPLVRDLPTRRRAVLVLRYYEGLSEAEIADVLGVSRGTVKSHAPRALAMLRKRIAADDAELGVAR
jgi:RNA polymerase sigma factor (sigma-70 family)